MSLKVGSEITAAQGITGIDTRRGREMKMRLFLLALQRQRAAEVVLGYEIICRNRERVRPQIFIAPPVSDLAMRGERESDENRSRWKRRPEAELLFFSPVGNAEGDHHENSAQR